MSVYVFKWDAWVVKRKDAGRFTIIYDALHTSRRLIDATIRPATDAEISFPPGAARNEKYVHPGKFVFK